MTSGQRTAPAALEGWEQGSFSADGRTCQTFRRGSGPAVVLIHEMPGLHPGVIELGGEIVAAGFTVVMPVLFGEPGKQVSAGYFAREFPRACISKEFRALVAGRTTLYAGWLRALSRSLHEELGGPGTGVIGMCFTGGFALAAMVDDSVAAPVVAQPSTPLPIGRRRSADLGLDADDLAAVRRRASEGCQVLGLQYSEDRATGTRFDTLQRELGQAFIRVEFPGAKHATLTLHRQQEGVDRLLAFLDDGLQDPADS